MDFNKAKEQALQWTKNSSIPFNLVGAIEEERRLIFEARPWSGAGCERKDADLHAPVSKVQGDCTVSTSLQEKTPVLRPCSFYVICPSCMKETEESESESAVGGDDGPEGDDVEWHVWSDEADVLNRLLAVQDFLHTCRKKKLVDILDKVFISLKKFLSTTAGDDEELEEDDDAGYQDNDDEEVGFSDAPDENTEVDDGEGMQMLPSSGGGVEEAGSFFVANASQMSVHRILKDLKQLQEDACRDFGIEGSPRGDNLFVWDVRLTNFPSDTLLGRDLERYATKYNREAVVSLEMRFPDDYPMAPPFVRITRPMFKSQTGHITIGGSICMEMLTRSGWRPTNDIEGILVQIRAEIMSDPNTCLDPHTPDREYNEAEAKTAFHRMVQRHGWK